MELPSKDIQGPDHPPLRCLIALHELFKFSDQTLSLPTIDWDGVLEQLSKKIGGQQLVVIGTSHRQNLEALGLSLRKEGPFTGLAREHLLYLAKVAREGMALRGEPLHWLDRVGWPEQEDPSLVVNWAEPPEAVKTAWSRLARLRNQLRSGNCSAAKDLGRSLF